MKKNVPSQKNNNLQKKKPSPLSKLFANRKFRCGGFSILLTLLVVVFVLLVNVFATNMEKTYGLQVDYSYNSLTHQSEVTKAILDQLTDNVEIFLMSTNSPDAIYRPEELRSILNTYDTSSDLIHVTQVDLIKNPAFFEQFDQTVFGPLPIVADCVVVYSKNRARAKVLDPTDYLNYSYNAQTGYYDIVSFSYEQTLSEAILYVSQEELPTLQILTGHGELTATDTATFERELSQRNYLLERVSLKKDQVLDTASPLFILSPQIDLSDGELTQLLDFAKAGGNFFIITQYTDPIDLPNFNALYSTYGIKPLEGICVAKTEETKSYFEDNPALLMPYMLESDVTQPLLDAGKDVLLLAGSRAFEITPSFSEDLVTQVVLQSGKAYLRNFLDLAQTLDQKESDPEGVYPLAVLTDLVQPSLNRSRAFFIGNSTVFMDEWIYANTYVTDFLMQVLQALQGKDPINLSIMPKSAYRESLLASGNSLALPTIIVLLVPLLIPLVALLVLAPRKNL